MTSLGVRYGQFESTEFALVEQSCRSLFTRRSRARTDLRNFRLGRACADRNELPIRQSKKGNGSPAKIQRVGRLSCFDGGERFRLQAGRRYDCPLCTSPLPLRPNGFNLATGSCHDFRLYKNAWPKWNGRNQSSRLKSRSEYGFLGPERNDERHNGPGSKNSISLRSGLDVGIRRSSKKTTEQSWGRLFQSQNQDQRGCERSQRHGPQLPPVLQRQRVQAQNVEENILHSRTDSKRTYPSVCRFPISGKQSQRRTSEALVSNVDSQASDKAFYRHRFCGQQKDYPSKDVRPLFDSSRQGREADRVWIKMGDQSNRRWIREWFFNKWWQTRLRHSFLQTSCSRTRGSVRRNSRDLWVRSRRLLAGEHREAEKTRSKEYWSGSQRQSRVGSFRDETEIYSARAGPSRGRHWRGEVTKIWIQQTRCAQYHGHGELRPTLIFGLQFRKIDERKSKSSSSRLLIVADRRKRRDTGRKAQQKTQI